MSLKLLQKSLEILEDQGDADKPCATDAGKKNKTFVPRNTTPRKQTVKDIKQDMKANSKKLDVNLKRLLALSQNSLKASDAEKILNRTRKEKQRPKKFVKVQEPKSIFTDKEFDEFEKEYFKA